MSAQCYTLNTDCCVWQNDVEINTNITVFIKIYRFFFVIKVSQTHIILKAQALPMNSEWWHWTKPEPLTSLTMCRTRSRHLHAFQYPEPCRAAMRYRYRMLDQKDAMQSPCSCQHQNIIVLHAVVLDVASKYCWLTWLFECLAVRWYGTSEVFFFFA